ncbi:hypothetical protein [Helicobacter sp. UBA3407]|uniref:hypothetical protein n=1 Tax=Helicobacter sp. UBA3407 TaxID=1946588 RepID=UPI002614472C|nr:hypothetical protein [Helicobacter sp. UBA3407]
MKFPATKDPLQGDFYTKETQKYFFEILAFKNKIQDSFKVKVESKKSLFIALDKIFEIISKEGQNNPFIGILFGGTLSHFLYAIVKISLKRVFKKRFKVFNLLGFVNRL